MKTKRFIIFARQINLRVYLYSPYNWIKTGCSSVGFPRQHSSAGALMEIPLKKWRTTGLELGPDETMALCVELNRSGPYAFEKRKVNSWHTVGLYRLSPIKGAPQRRVPITFCWSIGARYFKMLGMNGKSRIRVSVYVLPTPKPAVDQLPRSSHSAKRHRYKPVSLLMR